MFDFHNHLMPGVDDGAASVEEAREGLSALAAEGVGSVITTPHLPASVTRDEARRLRALSAIDKGWNALRALALQEFPHIWLERGVELLLDHPEPDLSDSRLRLAGTSFVLMEFPHMSIPPHSTLALRTLRSAGWKPILAHPERYSNFGNNLDLLEAWKDAGAFIQVNAGSIVGRYGKRARTAAWDIVNGGFADYVCSDYHSRGPLLLRAARAAFEAEGATRQWNLLTTTNPERIAKGEDPAPVDPVEPLRRPLWKRMTFRN